MTKDEWNILSEFCLLFNIAKMPDKKILNEVKKYWEVMTRKNVVGAKLNEDNSSIWNLGIQIWNTLIKDFLRPTKCPKRKRFWYTEKNLGDTWKLEDKFFYAEANEELERQKNNKFTTWLKVFEKDLWRLLGIGS